MLKLRLEKDLDLERISVPIVREKGIGKTNVPRREKKKQEERAPLVLLEDAERGG